MYLLQIISLVIYALVMYSANNNFKRTVLVWVPFSLLFNPQVCVTYSAPITALTVALDISLVLLYWVKCQKNLRKFGLNEGFFFFSPAISLMLMSYILATLFSEIPFMSSFNRLVKQLVDYFGIIIIMFRCLNTKEDLLLFFRSLVICAFIFCIDGIIEGVTGINLWGDFVYYNSRCDETTVSRGWHLPSVIKAGKVRFGMIRCYSFFQLHLMYGYACCLVLYVAMLMKSEGAKIIEFLNDHINNILYIALFVVLALSIIFCNSKGPMIMAIVILLTRYQVSDVFRPWILAPLVVAGFVIVYYFPDYLLNFISLVDDDVAEEGGGSTVQLRQHQYNIAFNLFMRNPLFGSGVNANSYYSHNGFEGLGGAESVWLKILPDQGIMGVIAYLYYYVRLRAGVANLVPFKVCFFFLLAVFIFDTTNGKPFQTPIWWISIFLFVRRYYQVKKMSAINTVISPKYDT